MIFRRYTVAVYRVCPFCGANLDPGERCDCQDHAKEQEQQEIRNDSKEVRTA